MIQARTSCSLFFIVSELLGCCCITAVCSCSDTFSLKERPEIWQPPTPSASIILVFHALLPTKGLPLAGDSLVDGSLMWGVLGGAESRELTSPSSPHPSPGLMVWSEPRHSHCSTSIKTMDKEAGVEPCSQFHSAKHLQDCRVWAEIKFYNTHVCTHKHTHTQAQDCQLLSSTL